MRGFTYFKMLKVKVSMIFFRHVGFSATQGWTLLYVFKINRQFYYTRTNTVRLFWNGLAYSKLPPSLCLLVWERTWSEARVIEAGLVDAGDGVEHIILRLGGRLSTLLQNKEEVCESSGGRPLWKTSWSCGTPCMPRVSDAYNDALLSYTTPGV